MEKMTDFVYQTLAQHGHHYRRGTIPTYLVMELAGCFVELEDEDEDVIRDYGDDLESLAYVARCVCDLA